MEKYKTCIDCKKSKIETTFAKKGKSSGRRNRCNTCHERRRSKRNPDKVREKNRRTHLKLNYNMSLEKYNELYTNQQGLCKICRNFNDLLFVDHCHTTGKVRGLLCNNCNSGLGFFRDNIEYLSGAILYLKETNTDKSTN